jgi:hypothetical protein
MNLRDQAARGGHALAGAHRLAHARQFVERTLRQREGAIVGAMTPLSICMKSVSSSCDRSPMGSARHARAALERVQRTLERRETIDTAAVLVPLRQSTLRGVDQLDGLVGEDAGNVLVEVGDDFFDDLGRRLCGLRSRRGCRY